jgi:hypothetical protein
MTRPVVWLIVCAIAVAAVCGGIWGYSGAVAGQTSAAIAALIISLYAAYATAQAKYDSTQLKPELQIAGWIFGGERLELRVKNVGKVAAEDCYGRLSVDATPGDIATQIEAKMMPLKVYGGAPDSMIKSLPTCWNRATYPEHVTIAAGGSDVLLIAKIFALARPPMIQLFSEEGEASTPWMASNGSIAQPQRFGGAFLKERLKEYSLTVEVGATNLSSPVLVQARFELGTGSDGSPSISLS